MAGSTQIITDSVNVVLMCKRMLSNKMQSWRQPTNNSLIGPLQAICAQLPTRPSSGLITSGGDRRLTVSTQSYSKGSLVFIVYSSHQLFSMAIARLACRARSSNGFIDPAPSYLYPPPVQTQSSIASSCDMIAMIGFACKRLR